MVMLSQRERRLSGAAPSKYDGVYTEILEISRKGPLNSLQAAAAPAADLPPRRRFSGALNHFLGAPMSVRVPASGPTATAPSPSPAAGPRGEWVDAIPGARSRYPIGERASTPADILA